MQNLSIAAYEQHGCRGKVSMGSRLYIRGRRGFENPSGFAGVRINRLSPRSTSTAWGEIGWRIEVDLPSRWD